MPTVIIAFFVSGLIGGLIRSIIFFYKNRKRTLVYIKEFWFEEMRTGFLATSGITIVVYGIILGLTLMNVDYHSERVAHAKIVSLDNGVSTQGEFVFGTGFINNQPVYFFYQKLPSGNLLLGSCAAERTELIEKDSDSFCDQYFQVSNNIILRISKSMNFTIANEWIEEHSNDRYTIQIPTHAVRREFHPN